MPFYTSRINLHSKFKLFNVNKNNVLMGIQKNPPKRITWISRKRKPFGCVPRRFGFIQLGCYASFVNITNFSSSSEQNVHKFLGFFSFARTLLIFRLYLTRCQSTIQPFYVICIVQKKCEHYFFIEIPVKLNLPGKLQQCILLCTYLA